MSTGRKVALFLVGYALLLIAVGLIFGSDGKNVEFQPQNEFLLEPWVSIDIAGIDMSINKAVLYLFLAAGFTCWAMVAIARRMQAKPNKVQMAVEVAYDVVDGQIARDNLDTKMAAKWFPFLGTLFFFILFSNFIGLIPLPTNTEHPIHIFGLEVPSFALYAATANISIPLALTLMVWFAYHFVGIKTKGFIPYLKSWVPAGVEGVAAIPIFFIEVISHFVRIISLSVRLFANILAGHLIILFMSGGLAVLLGLEVLGVFTLPFGIVLYLFELGLVATLQAFIFATLSAIYIGGAVAETH